VAGSPEFAALGAPLSPSAADDLTPVDCPRHSGVRGAELGDLFRPRNAVIVAGNSGILTRGGSLIRCYQYIFYQRMPRPHCWDDTSCAKTKHAAIRIYLGIFARPGTEKRRGGTKPDIIALHDPIRTYDWEEGGDVPSCSNPPLRESNPRLCPSSPPTHTTHNAFGVGLRVGIEDEAPGQSYLKTDVSSQERERGKA
jgi:hypothetical protein